MAQAHAEEDHRKRDEIEARNTADGRVYQIEKLLEENRDKVTPDDERAIRAGIDEVRKAMEGGGKDAIQEALKRLEEASHRLAESLYQKTGTPPAGGPGSGPAGSPPGGASGSPGARKEGDVIDAEYVDVDETKR